MARRKLQVTAEGVNYEKGTPPLQDIINSVSESDYRDAIANIADVQAHWNAYKRERGGGEGLTMISGITPGKDWNTKISKNAAHPHPAVRAAHQMGMSLSPGETSGMVETCAGCRTAQCSAICNAYSGKGAIPGGPVQRAQHIRTSYWVDHPQHAGALAVHESKQGAAMARSIGMIPILRANMWSDINIARTTLRGPWVEDFEEKAGPHRGEGLAQEYPLMTHSNYTKETSNRVLREGEKEPEEGLPSNYKLTMSISEQTPVKRVQQRYESGRTSRAVVWATPTQEKPQEWTMEDRAGRGTFPSFDADILDAVALDKEIGNEGVGLLRQKQTAGLRTLKGQMDNTSMVRPLDPDAPVGSRTGIPKDYASPEFIEQASKVTDRARLTAGPSSVANIRPSRSKAFRGE